MSENARTAACACGAMPVVTDIPSFRAITGGGSIGALWKPGDAGDCARALIHAGRRDLTRREARAARFVDWGLAGALKNTANEYAAGLAAVEAYAALSLAGAAPLRIAP